ncbi:MAG: MSMEG_1061 family FMN-dependent PPOX-type flavoprotein [Pseudomonadota bacterium]
MKTEYLIQSEAELKDMYGTPIALVENKFTRDLVEEMLEFVEASPLMFIATMDASSGVDISPRGDAPGFVKVDDEGRLLIADRPGNKLIHSHKNIVRNQSVGLIFVVPNLTETLRVKGRAVLSRDPALLNELSVNGKPALLCTVVKPEQCWFHCGKAMVRSKVWNPEHWETYGDSPMVRQFLNVLGTPTKEARDAMEKEKEKNYRDELY